MKLKPIISLAVAVFLMTAATITAQTISYAYDSSGNRIKREIRMSVRNKPGQADVEDVHVQERLSDRDIRIYPNQKTGVVTVEIVGYEAGDFGSIYIVSLSGQTLLSSSINSSISSIDINFVDDGVYILYISLNGKNSSWKFIKE